MSKNNHQLLTQRSIDRQPHYGLRKLSVGVASVLLSTTCYLGLTSVAHADAVLAGSNSVPTTTQPVANPTPATGSQVGEATIPADVPALAKQSIINNPANVNQVPVENGLEHTLTIDVNGQSTDPGQAQAIMNADQLNEQGNFTVKATATNTSTNQQRVDQVITLPGYNQAQAIKDDANHINPKVAGPITVTSNQGQLGNCQLLLATTPGKLQTAGTITTQAGFSWDQVVEIQIITNLLPGQSYTLNVPMQIANMAQMKDQLNAILQHSGYPVVTDPEDRTMQFSDMFYYWDQGNAFHSGPITNEAIRLEVPDVNTAQQLLDVNEAFWMMTLQKAGDHMAYEQVPESIQALAPKLQNSNIHFINFDGETDNPDVVFTDGAFTIDTRPFFEAIKNAGYTTNVMPAGNALWPIYSYNVTNTRHVISADGVVNDQPDGTVQPYVEVQRVFDPKNITLTVGGQYDQSMNLNSAPTIRYTDPASMDPTKQVTLAYNVASGQDTYQIDLSQLPTAMKDGHLIVTTPGIYQVKFSHAINTKDVVTDTALITVLGSQTYTRTINYVDDQGNAMAPSVTQTTIYIGTPAVQDDQTVITWAPAKGQSGNLPAVATPTVEHWTADQANVPAESIVTDGANATPLVTEVTVKYSHTLTTKPVTQTTQRVIHYVDAQGSQVAPDATQMETMQGTATTDEVTGKTTFVWEPVVFSRLTSPKVPGFTTAQGSVKTIQVTQPDGTIADQVVYTPNPTKVTQETKTITRTINIYLPDGQLNKIVQKVVYHRTATKDLVTGTVTYGDWQTDQAPIFEQEVMPQVAGYVPEISVVGSKLVNVTDGDTVVDVVYKTAPQQVKRPQSPATSEQGAKHTNAPVTKAGQSKAPVMAISELASVPTGQQDTKLPQTGNQAHQTAVVVGLSLLTVTVSLFGFGKHQKQE